MNRSEQIAKLNEIKHDLDILVIGGGATGLAIALDAASRGFNTALLEAADFAEGTSSKSTKLIHGGVRYLRGGEIGLVREALLERGRLLKNAPRLVKPIPFIVPAYRWFDRFYYGTGLSLYDFLAGNLGIDKTGHFPLEKTIEAAPNLNRKNLRGGTHYWDAQFDDSRLAVAMARTATAEGSVVLNHAKVTSLTKINGIVSGVVAQDSIGNQEIELKAKAVINATGVFTDSIRKMDSPDAEALISPSQGIHISLDKKFLGSETGIMIPETSDGRVLFAIPWLNRVILGTTDTPGVPIELEPHALESEVDYLIEHAALYLEKAPQKSDIKATFAGLRPLVSPPTSVNGKTSKISRKHSLFVSDSGLITMTGGKWTTCRSMAEAAVARAIEVGSLENQPCRTADLPLLDDFDSGSIESETPIMKQKVDDAFDYTFADVALAIRQEQAETLDDVLSRRTRCRFLDAEGSLRCAERTALFMAAEKGYGPSWVDEQVSDFSNKVEPSSYVK